MAKKDRFNDETVFNEVLKAKPQNEATKAKDEIKKILNKKIIVTAKNESQKKLLNSIDNDEITICAGLAGTGKTYLAVAEALSLLQNQNNEFRNIYLVKSAITLKGEDLGYIPGTIKEKLDPIMASYYINIEKVIGKNSLDSLINKDIIRVLPLAYIRGVSLDNCIIILDETQNVTISNSRTLLTRIGSNCKLIVLGDTNQIDIKDEKESSLKLLTVLFNDVNKIGVIEMDVNDVNIRNPLIDDIERKYTEYFKEKNKTVKYPTKNNKQLLVETAK
jgi:phosphate starvation-inducible PhoH-like protein